MGCNEIAGEELARKGMESLVEKLHRGRGSDPLALSLISHHAGTIFVQAQSPCRAGGIGLIIISHSH
jgi:hypothetical protein